MWNLSTEPIDAEQIAKAADRGEDISAHFTRQFRVVKPAVQRTDVALSAPMVHELDREAEALNVSRDAIIKSMLRESLDRRHLAEQARRGR